MPTTPATVTATVSHPADSTLNDLYPGMTCGQILLAVERDMRETMGGYAPCDPINALRSLASRLQMAAWVIESRKES